jgi:ornithine carbamoyltransferase
MWARLDAPITRLKGNPLAGRDLLRLIDLEPVELHMLLSTVLAQKQAWQAGIHDRPYVDKAVAVILEKPSLRTRVSFELGAKRLGADAVVMSGSDSAFSRGESVKDTVKVLERFVDAIVLRTFGQDKLVAVAEAASVPVVNALSDSFHPCQALADLLTIYEHKGDFSRLKIAYVGDGNNMAQSYLEAAALVGLRLSVATPKSYRPDARVVNECQAIAVGTGAAIALTHDPLEAVSGADVVITDTWASMGSESEHDERVRAFAPYRVTQELMEKAADGAIFLHCLPAHRGEEVSDEVMDSAYSKIYDEAENRLHAQKTLLSLLLADSR